MNKVAQKGRGRERGREPRKGKRKEREKKGKKEGERKREEEKERYIEGDLLPSFKGINAPAGSRHTVMINRTGRHR